MSTNIFVIIVFSNLLFSGKWRLIYVKLYSFS
jgi:hypothetical protein